MALQKHDKKSYDAFLLAGKAAFKLGECVQAETAYKKAVELARDRPHAWQGLVEVLTASDPNETAEAAKQRRQKLLEPLQVLSRNSLARRVGRSLWG